MQTIVIKAAKPYQVHIGHGLLATTGQLVKTVAKPAKIALVMDDTVASFYADKVLNSLALSGLNAVEYRFAPGEQAKSMRQLSGLLEFLAGSQLGRHDLIIALGGGVTGDLAGFAAAVYQRGIDYIQMPTTLLAAVDSSVGGKTAINLIAGKNLAGVFWQPRLVICDSDTLDTLPRAELAAGAAECVKYGLLNDQRLLATLTEDGLAADWQQIIPVCVEQKARIVAADEKERGQRQLLNLGHTIGHAIEHLSDYAIRHGEAVGMGMMIITRAAEKLNICAPGTADEIAAALLSLGLPIECSYSAGQLAQAALQDKKRRGSSINLVLPKQVGECILYSLQITKLEKLVKLGLEG